jgi:hypothetical protein
MPPHRKQSEHYPPLKNKELAIGKTTTLYLTCFIRIEYDNDE